MTVVTKNVGRLPGYPASPEYDSQTAYGRKQRCIQYGCEIESLVDNNTYTPFTWDGDETFTLDGAHWRLISGNPKVWAAGNPKPAASEEYPYNGMGRVVIPKNMVNIAEQGEPENIVNLLTQDAFEDGEGNPLTDTVFVIQYDFVLGEDITIPANCVLEFYGGSLSGSYTLTGTDTGIRAELVKIFNTNIITAGTWNITNVYPEWFGAKGVDDDTAAIRKALVLGTGHTVVFSRSRTYKLYDNVEIFSNTEVVIDGVIDNILYGCFELFSCTTEQPGYTGVTNVYIHGNGVFNCNGHLDPDGNIGIATPFRIAHCTDITVEGLTLKDYKCHCVEISGSKNIYLKNIKFLGNTYNSVYGINEAIQLERVSKDGIIGAIPYDYTIAKDVIIDSCIFGPSDNSNYMAKAIGSHDGINDPEKPDAKTFSNITIKNCIFKNIPNVPGDPYVIDLDSNYKDVCIKDNVFDNIFEKCINIGVYTDGVIIKDNIFKELYQLAIYLNADSDVEIRNNKFIKCQKIGEGAVVWNSSIIKNYRIIGNYVELASENASKPFHMPDSAYSPSVVFKDNIIANASILTGAAIQDFYEQLSRFEYRSESAPMGRNYTLYYTDVNRTTTKGPTANRPKAWIGGQGMLSKESNIGIGFTYFDTDLGKPIYVKDIDSNNNVVWVDGTDAVPGTSTSGTFANKPTVSANSIPIGFKYFCTDKQSPEQAVIDPSVYGIEIIHKGNDAWVDALGRVVS